MTSEYITKDLWLASAISLQLKTPPKLRNEYGLVLFVFSASDSLQSAISNYYSGSLLSATAYADEVKRLRNDMYAARSQG